MKWYRCEFEVEETNLCNGKGEKMVVSTKDYAEDKERAIEQAINFLIMERGYTVIRTISCREVNVI